MFRLPSTRRATTPLFRFSSSMSNGFKLLTNSDFRARLMHEIKTAMKARDTMAATTYRSVLSEINNADKAARQPLTSSAMIGIVRKAVQRRDEAALKYREATRVDLADKEEKEAMLLHSILPPLLTNEEIDEHLQAILMSLPADNDHKRSIGIIFREFYSRVDQARVARDAVKRRLEALIQV